MVRSAAFGGVASLSFPVLPESRPAHPMTPALTTLIMVHEPDEAGAGNDSAPPA